MGLFNLFGKGRDSSDDYNASFEERRACLDEVDVYTEGGKYNPSKAMDMASKLPEPDRSETLELIEWNVYVRNRRGDDLAGPRRESPFHR